MPNETAGEPRPWMESDVDRLARGLHERGEDLAIARRSQPILIFGKTGSGKTSLDEFHEAFKLSDEEFRQLREWKKGLRRGK